MENIRDNIILSIVITLLCNGVIYSQNADSLNDIKKPYLNIRENIFNPDRTGYPDNIFLKGTITLNKIALPGYYFNNSNSFSGLSDPFLRKYLKNEAIKNDLIQYIQNSAPQREAEEIRAIRKYLGISRDIFAVILAIIHIITY